MNVNSGLREVLPLRIGPWCVRLVELLEHDHRVHGSAAAAVNDCGMNWKLLRQEMGSCEHGCMRDCPVPCVLVDLRHTHIRQRQRHGQVLER